MLFGGPSKEGTQSGRSFTKATPGTEEGRVNAIHWTIQGSFGSGLVSAGHIADCSTEATGSRGASKTGDESQPRDAADER